MFVNSSRSIVNIENSYEFIDNPIFMYYEKHHIRAYHHDHRTHQFHLKTAVISSELYAGTEPSLSSVNTKFAHPSDFDLI